MGLDQYLTGRKYLGGRYAARPREEDGFPVEQVELAIGYWRKHPNLHGYIVNEFGPKDEATGEPIDNCQDIDLDANAIHKIIEAIQQDTLPQTEGFFFGTSYSKSEASPEDQQNYLEQKAEDLEIFGKSLGWLTFTDPKDNAHAGAFGVAKYVIYRASW